MGSCFTFPLPLSLAAASAAKRKQPSAGNGSSNGDGNSNGNVNSNKSSKSNSSNSNSSKSNSNNIQQKQGKIITGKRLLAKWHVTEIAWPPAGSEGLATAEKNLDWLRQDGLGAIVADEVNAFDLGSYFEGCGVDVDDVVLCIWAGAHGRNYSPDSDAIHEVLKKLGWSKATFREAAFASMCGALPQATVLSLGRQWEATRAQLSRRPIVMSKAFYPEVDGPRFVPEGSTRSERYHLPGFKNEYVGVAAVGPKLLQHFQQHMTLINVPQLVAEATDTGGTVLFVGEFTAAQARHCAQYLLERDGAVSTSQVRSCGCDAPSAPKLEPEHRCFYGDPYNLYTYKDFLSHARKHPEASKLSVFFGAHMWMNSRSTDGEGLDEVEWVEQN